MILMSILWAAFAIDTNTRYKDRFAPSCGCILSLMFSVLPLLGVGG